MKRKLKRVLEWFLFLFAGTGPILDEAVLEDLCDHSGQGRDKNGR